MVRIPKAAPALFPEPDHAPEKTFQDQLARLQQIDPLRGLPDAERPPRDPDADPWDSPDGEYPLWLDHMLHEMYDRVFNRVQGHRHVDPDQQDEHPDH